MSLPFTHNASNACLEHVYSHSMVIVSDIVMELIPCCVVFFFFFFAEVIVMPLPDSSTSVHKCYVTVVLRIVFLGHGYDCCRWLS